jgi:hypothetical protein
MEEELGKEVEEWRTRYAMESRFAIYALQFFGDEKSARYLLSIYKVAVQAITEEKAASGKELDETLAREIAYCIRQSGSAAAKILLGMLSADNKKEV